MGPPGWLISLKDDIWNWLLSVRVSGNPGWIRFCKEGALFEPGVRSGLGMSCLALKTIFMLGLLDRLEQGELDAWIRHIKSFQTIRGKSSGYFEDHFLLRYVDRNAGLLRRDWAVRRAETRQAIASLLCVGSGPDRPILFLPKTEKSLHKFLSDLPWENPWSAGSHASHLMAFLSINERLGCYPSRKGLLTIVLNKLDSLQDPETGCWFRGRPSVEQMINGAMKVITGYDFVGIKFNFAERLIDFALTLKNDLDACHHADFIYVLHKCSQITSYRIDEIKVCAEERLSQILQFRKKDAGFSFRKEGSGLSYYGFPVSKGLPVSDIHGTTLFVWALVMIADILGWRKELGWNLPIT